MNNAKKELLMAALLKFPTIREAAKSAKIPETTAFRILKDKEFAEEYKTRKKQIVEESNSYLRSQTIQASKILVHLMTNPQTPAQTRYNASKTVLEFDGKNAEREEILERITHLESIIGEK